MVDYQWADPSQVLPFIFQCANTISILAAEDLKEHVRFKPWRASLFFFSPSPLGNGDACLTRDQKPFCRFGRFSF